MSKYTLGSCFNDNFTHFQTCATKIMDNIDLVIPREKFDESMIMLHKMSCLPLSNFAYIEKVHTKSNFRLSDQNMKKVLEYHKRDIWFSEKAREKFEKLFRKFQAEHCSSENCSAEVEQLREENRKLKIGCGYETKTYDKLHLTEFSVNWTKLLNDSDLALRCLSFSLTNDRTVMVKMYNEMLKTVNKTQLAHRLSTKLIDTMKNKLKPFK